MYSPKSETTNENYLFFSFDGKAYFSAAITPVFSVTWTFKIHSNVDLVLNKFHIIFTVENDWAA